MTSDTPTDDRARAKRERDAAAKRAKRAAAKVQHKAAKPGPKKAVAEPVAVVAAEPVYKKLEDMGAILRIGDLRSLAPLTWTLPIFPAPGVGMLVGPKSSLKSFVLLTLAGMKAYGQPWLDGTPIAKGMAFIVTNENIYDRDEWPNRHAAWLTDNGIQVAFRMQDNIRIVNPVSPLFRRVVSTKGGGSRSVDNLDLLDDESVRTAINAIRVNAAAEVLPVGFVAFDTLTSLVHQKMTVENAKVLVAHLHLIANELKCFVLLVNHSHRKRPREYQGPAALATNMDAHFIAARDNTPGRFRTILEVERLKSGADGYSLEFQGSLINLGVNSASIAMRLTGMLAETDPISEASAATARMLADRMRDGDRLSINGAVKLLGWTEGGEQHKVLRKAIPEEWLGIALPTGVVREIRRVIEGKRQWIECREITSKATPDHETVIDDDCAEHDGSPPEHPAISAIEPTPQTPVVNGRMARLKTVELPKVDWPEGGAMFKASDGKAPTG
jgi:hypothetical protein